MGRRNGTAVLTATTVGGKATATCKITIGTGEPDPEGVDIIGKGGEAWQNGSKEYKKIQLKSTLRASNWKDSKGKVKNGKLVWLASDEPLVVDFDETKHTVLTKSKPANGSVNNKGVVTAKKAGTLYVYCCDTGKLQVEQFIVTILAAPSKLFLGDSSGVSESSDALKKLSIPVGKTEKVYICPYVKDGTADEDNEFKVSVAKSEMKKYVSISEIKKDDNGASYFEVTALDFDRSKKKPASVKLNVVSKQSGKKASITVITYNPVNYIAAVEKSGKTTDLKLSKKGDTLSFKLDIDTYVNGVSDTTDKLKLYSGKEYVDLDENKVTKDSGATVKLKYDKNTKTFTLTASKDAGKPAIIAAVVTNPQWKESELFELVEVDESGNVKVFK